VLFQLLLRVDNRGKGGLPCDFDRRIAGVETRGYETVGSIGNSVLPTSQTDPCGLKLGSLLKRAREEINYSLEDLSVATGLTLKEIAEIEADCAIGDIRALRIAAVLRMEIDLAISS
tara:strand:- start:268 stop:618 length:351 start_codon:yes stop_codon:yes gene_type:complete